MSSVADRVAALPREKLVTLVLQLSQTVEQLQSKLRASEADKQRLSDQLYATRQQWSELQTAVTSVSQMMQHNYHDAQVSQQGFAFDADINEALNVVAEQELRGMGPERDMCADDDEFDDEDFHDDDVGDNEHAAVSSHDHDADQSDAETEPGTTAHAGEQQQQQQQQQQQEVVDALAQEIAHKASLGTASQATDARA